MVLKSRKMNNIYIYIYIYIYINESTHEEICIWWGGFIYSLNKKKVYLFVKCKNLNLFIY